MAEPDKKLLKEVRDFLTTRKGEKYTTLGGVAAHFDMSLTQMLCKIGCDPVIYAAIEKNKARIKEKMRQVWRMANKPNLQIAAYRLEADEEELNRLSGESPQSRGLERKDPLLEVLQADKVWSD
jgi:hypothetical protein